MLIFAEQSRIMGESEQCFNTVPAHVNSPREELPMPDKDTTIRPVLSQFGREPYISRFITAPGVRTRSAHRVAFFWAFGHLPRLLDHIECDTPRCTNPQHLIGSTHRANTLRGTGPTAINAAKTHCNYGHEFGERDWRIIKDVRVRRCRNCHSLERSRKKRTKGRA
jgi:hypothetical protein